MEAPFPADAVARLETGARREVLPEHPVGVALVGHVGGPPRHVLLAVQRVAQTQPLLAAPLQNLKQLKGTMKHLSCRIQSHFQRTGHFLQC